MFVSPIHTSMLRGHPVRFFKSPEADPDMPWHSTDDFYKALDLPRDLRRMLLRGLGNKWKRDTRMVDTESGVTTIAPHYMAQGIIGGIISVRRATDQLEIDYTTACAGAIEALVAGLPLDKHLEWVIAAGRRHIHGDEGRAA